MIFNFGILLSSPLLLKKHEFNAHAQKNKLNKIEIDDFSLIVMESGSQLLNGSVPFRILDKGYVTQKEFKKLSKAHAKTPTYLGGGEDDYHIKIQSL